MNHRIDCRENRNYPKEISVTRSPSIDFSPIFERRERRGGEETRGLLNNLPLGRDKFLINTQRGTSFYRNKGTSMTGEALGCGLLKPIWFHEAPQVSRNVMQVSRQDGEDCGKERRSRGQRSVHHLIVPGTPRSSSRKKKRKKKIEATIYSCIRTLATLCSNTNEVFLVSKSRLVPFRGDASSEISSR